MPSTAPPPRPNKHSNAPAQVNTWEYVLNNIRPEDMEYIFDKPSDVLDILDDVLEIANGAFFNGSIPHCNEDIYKFTLAIQAIGRFESLINSKLFEGLENS